MTDADALLAGVSAVHAAGIDPARWPGALEGLARAANASAATLESYDLAARRHRLWHGHGVDPDLLDEYLSLFDGRIYARPTPIEPFPPGHVEDRTGRARQPFFRAYLGEMDLRQFAVGLLESPPGVQTILTLRRGPRQGEMTATDLRAFRHFTDHVALALSVNGRLSEARSELDGAWSVLDWLSDGAGLVGGDRRLRQANAALADLLRAEDGLRLRRGLLDIASRSASRRFSQALALATAFARGENVAAPPSVTVPRPSGAPPLTLTLRPMMPAETEGRSDVVVALFVRDPLAGAGGGNAAAALGLTPAEARLAQALQNGVSPSDYAREDGVSINTVYTHLRRLKDKAGVSRLAELIGTLIEMEPRLRPLGH